DRPPHIAAHLAGQPRLLEPEVLTARHRRRRARRGGRGVRGPRHRFAVARGGAAAIGPRVAAALRGDPAGRANRRAAATPALPGEAEGEAVDPHAPRWPDTAGVAARPAGLPP